MARGARTAMAVAMVLVVGAAAVGGCGDDGGSATPGPTGGGAGPADPSVSPEEPIASAGAGKPAAPRDVGGGPAAEEAEGAPSPPDRGPEPGPGAGGPLDAADAALAGCLETASALAALRLSVVGGPGTVDEVAGLVDELAPDVPPAVRTALEDAADDLAARGPAVLDDPDGGYAAAEAVVLDHLAATCGTG